VTDLSAALSEINRRRVRVLGPLMVLLHLLHIAFFHVPPHLRATLPAETLRWRDGLCLVHGLTLPPVLIVSWLAFRVTTPRIARFYGPATALIYLVHGAIIAGIDQIVSSNISAYIGYCMGIAVVVSMPPRLSIALYTLAEALMVVCLIKFQPAAATRLTNFPTSLTVALMGIAISWLLDNGRRREIRQRAIIDRQRDELTALNHSLEQRVRDQVREIVARADEVERLNAQLQAQVVARSGELSLALARLARQRDADGKLANGLVLAERFVVAEPIGKGGMGTVYAGRDRTTSERVAIKVIQAASSRQLDAMRRFIREAGAAAKVSHAAVVRMLHVDVTDDGLLFQVQELVDGETLLGLFNEHALSPALALRVGAVLCDALATAHALGVVHRDVKPDNIMLTVAAPGLKLLDFGIAKLHDVVRELDASRDAGTEARMIVGTPGYMAPEQAHGLLQVSDRADVYAVGVLLHQMLSGPQPDPELLMPDVAPPLAMLVRHCHEEKPSARPSAAELSAALLQLAAAERAPPLESLVQTLLGRPRNGTPSEVVIPTTPRRRSPA
jgi:serine/threonine-protein kinase